MLLWGKDGERFAVFFVFSCSLPIQGVGSAALRGAVHGCVRACACAVRAVHVVRVCAAQVVLPEGSAGIKAILPLDGVDTSFDKK